MKRLLLALLGVMCTPGCGKTTDPEMDRYHAERLRQTRAQIALAEELRPAMRALHEHIVTEDLTAINAALDAEPRLVHAAEVDGTTAISRALHARKARVAHLLLQRGVDPDADMGSGWRPLHLAAKYGMVELVGLLLDHGADIDMGNGGGKSALQLASMTGELETVELLIRRNARVRHVDRFQETALHTLTSSAAGLDEDTQGMRTRKAKIAKLLLTAGADTAARDDRDRTPLEKARAEHQKAVAEVLQDAS